MSRVLRLKRLVILMFCLVPALFLWVWWSQGQRQSRGARHPEDLTRAFLHAVEALRLHQTAAGYWTTPVTRGPAFEQPWTEVNVFVPALILDVLEPIAQETRLTDVLDRTRGYLRDQIEATGLVRYHRSADVGYALWLRLYVEVARHWPGSLPLPTPSAKAP